MAAAVRAQQGAPAGMAQPAATLCHDASRTSAQRPSTSSTSTLPSSVAARSQNTPPHSLSPSSVSPASPQQPLPAFAKRGPISNVRPAQIRNPKGVGFVPAALRPTERPPPPRCEIKGLGHSKAHSIAGLRSSPPTPPHSLHSSTDNLAGAGAAANANASIPASRKSSSSSHSSNTLMNKLTPIEIPDNTDPARPVSCGSALLSSPTKSFSSASLYSMVSNKAPHPTTAHWVPDSLVNMCEAPVCPTKFGLINRRHHCRRCGGIFCGKHTVRSVPLDTEARMIPTPLGSSVSSSPSTPRLGQQAGVTTPDESDFGWWKACDNCYNQWVEWVEGLQKQRGNGQEPSFSLQMPAGIDMNAPGLERKNSTAGSVAGSVPRDWSWSTF